MMHLPPAAYWVTGLVSVVLGYGLRVLVERATERRRERVLRALGGKLPDWELRARALEDQSDAEALQGYSGIAASRQRDADLVRRLGRKRARERR